MNIQIISIILEAIIVIFCLATAIIKNRLFAYGFALTFFVYVFYDSVNYFGLPISSDFLYILFFLATVSAFLATILMYIEEDVKKSRKKIGIIRLKSF
jgi:hypothetical protein